MKKQRITKIIAMLLSLVIMCGLGTGVYADGAKKTENNPVITNAGGIIFNGFSMNSDEITVNGSYSGARADIITYIVYEKGNQDNLITIGETRSTQGIFEFVFGVNKQTVPQKLVIEVKSEREQEKATAEISINDYGLNLAGKIAEVKTLLDICKEKGIVTDYQRVKYATAVQINGMINTYLSNGESEAYAFNTQKASELLDEAKAKLEAYIAGTETPLKVNRTVTSKPKVDGKSFISKMDDGSEKPVFYVGYAHWSTNDIEQYKDLGVNYIHYEVSASDILKRPCPAKEWEIDYINSDNENPYTYTMNAAAESGAALQIDSAGKGELDVKQTVPVEPNTTYTFGMDFKCNNASAILIKADGAQWAQKSVYASNGEVAEWQSVSHTVTTGANQTEMTFIIDSRNDAEKLMYKNAYVKKNGSGANLIQNSGFSTINNDKFTVNKDTVAQIKNVFERAEKNDVRVVFLLAMHNFPEFVYEYDETANGSKEGWDWTFMPFNPTHPLVLETLTAAINAVVPEIKDYKSLGSICLSNEPLFAANQRPTYYKPIYQQYIRDKYNNSINDVNAAYGTAYSDFSQLEMPSGERKSDDSGKVTSYNDYREFNESIMIQYHKTMADAVKSIDSSLLLNVKQMTPFGAYGTSNNRVEYGMNHEKLSQFLDINGCDAIAYYGSDQDTLLAKTMWYDYLTSVKNAPVINSEDHILRDAIEGETEQVRSEEEFKMNMADLWQGAIHGRGASALWMWDKSDWTKKGTGYYNTNLTRRADYIAEIGKIALDLNRLSGEITAIQQAKPRVGILYSDNSMSQIPYALEATYKAYSKVLTSGEKAFFVTEEQPELLNTTEGLELLIVPCSNYMKAETLNQIKRFIDGGGKVLMLKANNKEWLTENGKAHDTALLNSVLSASETAELKATSSSRVEDTNGAVNTKLDDMLNQLTMKDVTLTVKNGEVEWAEASYGRKHVINICNHGTVPVEVTLNVPSEYNAAETVDLLSKEKVGGSFTVQPNEPMLLSIQGDSVTKFLNTNGETVNHISGNKMSASVLYYGEEPNESVTHIVAVYENGCLKNLFTNSVQTGVAGTAKSEIEFDIDNNIDLDKCTVKSFLFDSFENIKPLLPAKEISRQ